MAGAGLLFLIGGRSEMVRGLRGDGRDEYWERMDVHASYLAGMADDRAIIGMCLWEWANGRSGTPYVQLGAIAGVAYVAALGALRSGVEQGVDGVGAPAWRAQLAPRALLRLLVVAEAKKPSSVSDAVPLDLVVPGPRPRAPA